MTTLLDRQSQKKHGDVREVYHLGHRPPDGSLSATDWLLQERCRVDRSVPPSVRVFHVLDRPIKNRKEFDRLGDEGRAAVLQNLDDLRDGLLAADVGTIPDLPTWNWARKWGYVLPHGQLLWPPEAARPIEGPYRQPEAQAILGAEWLAGTSLDQHWETDPFGETEAKCGRPNLTRHRNGSAQCHLKTGGQSTRLITADADNHGLVLPPEVHADRVVAFLELVQQRWPELRPHVTNLNYDDRSCHLPLHLPKSWSLDEARAWLAKLREEFPWLREWQFYPIDMQGIRCPLSPDKGTIVDVVLGEAEHRRRSYGGKFARFQGHDWAAYLEWLEADRPCDLALVRQELTRALDPAEVPKVRVMDRKGTPAPGRKGRKGREKAMQVGLWTGELKPAPGEFGSFVAFTLRCLVLGYGWTPEAAADWVMEQVDALDDASFILRLGRRGGRNDLRKSLLRSARKFARDNGYQPFPNDSLDRIKGVVACWDRQGFVLHDRSTWPRPGDIRKPSSSVEGRPLEPNEGMDATLAAAAVALSIPREEATRALEALSCRLTRCGELGYRCIQGILRKLGLPSCWDRVSRLMKSLQETGFLKKVGNHFFHKDSTFRKAASYVLGSFVRFMDMGPRHDAELVCRDQGAVEAELVGREEGSVEAKVVARDEEAVEAELAGAWATDRDSEPTGVAGAQQPRQESQDTIGRQEPAARPPSLHLYNCSCPLTPQGLDLSGFDGIGWLRQWRATRRVPWRRAA